jgi:hypothetical protein
VEVQRLKWTRAPRVVEEGDRRRVRMFYSPPRRRNTANRKGAEVGASDAEKQSQSQSRPHRADPLITNDMSAHALGHLIPAIAAYRFARSGATLAEATRAFKIAIESLEEAVC